MSERQTPDGGLFEGVPFDKVLNCVHCGLCLEACPTYQTLGVEQDSPRGRLYLMRGLWEGELALSPEVQAPLDRCLDCRACERACPSNVPYGSLLEQARGVLAKQEKPVWWVRLLRSLAFRRMLPSTVALTWFARMSLLYQKLGGPWLVLRSPFGKLMPSKFRNAHRLMPQFSASSFKRSIGGQAQKPTVDGGRKRKVAMFTGCVMDVADRQIHAATLKVLRAAGCEVVIPQDQGCCGALQVHNGDRETARQLALRNAHAFEGQFEQVIVNAAGCGAQLHEYDALFSEVRHTSQVDWAAFGKRFIDVMAFLAEGSGWVAENSWRDEMITVLYDAPCHLIHAQGVVDAPQVVIEKLPGVRFVWVEGYQHCCGAAGTYNVVQPELSQQILRRKIEGLKQTHATVEGKAVLVTGNPGCIYQWRAGIREAGLPVEVQHPAELIASRLLG